MAKFKETPAMEGRLTIKIIRDGVVMQTAQHNLVVNGGRANMAALLGGQGAAVSQIGVGENDDPAALTDTALENAVKVNVSETRIGQGLEADDGSTYDDPKIVQFHFAIGFDAAVGLSISEYGLFAGATLVSRVVRSVPFVKTAMDKIIGFWEIRF